ncbi:SIR2 family protein [Segatella copri]|uniref:SIR2 family protein n=1 Tax=Segatella copri TaxID=165179 RepID=UPI0022307DB6|nr:SIR2 family protein [Segatella copri]MCW4086313.1 SIR2 family protein [Segatella copri]MCW4158111.1 SIR2 family protein [Segatella copri]
MDNQQIANLLNIQRASRENRLVIFVGAGVSMNSSVPSWNQLTNRMKAELPNEFSEETDALKIAQIYKDSRGHKEYMDKVKDILLYNKAVPNPLHKSILALNPCHIITTNYDDLIEQELSKDFLQYHIIREDKDIPQMTYPNTLVKMHGDYVTDNIVLTEDDYYNYKENFPLTRAFVQSLFASKLILFVGFSFADLNLKFILNELKNILSDKMQRPYLLSCDEPSYATKLYFVKKGVNIVYISEADVDLLNDGKYQSKDLSGIGLHTDKLLYAIKNYSAIPQDNLALYLYNRIVPYMSEMRSFGDGLQYFFPKMKLHRKAHSSGLRTFTEYFKQLAKDLATNEAKRKFLRENPAINLRTLMKLAYYNYLFEIDGLTILDAKLIENIKEFKASTLDYIHQFDSAKVNQIVKKLRVRRITYTIEDLELPYILYTLGDAYSAYKFYGDLLTEYWNKKKYILYFICRHNMWAIRYCVCNQLWHNDKYDEGKEIELASSTNLDTILAKLPIESEVKMILQDMISYRSIGDRTLHTVHLKEEIYQQRKNAENGGGSINSFIPNLMSQFYRESLFSWANFIIWDNNAYFKQLSENNALGILNSFATPSSSMFGGYGQNTRICALDAFMLESLIFSIDHKRLREIIKGYDIKTLSFSQKGVNYITSCLDGLLEKTENMFVDEKLFFAPLNNLLLIISKAKDERIDSVKIYDVVVKYLNNQYYNRQFESDILMQIICNYAPNVHRKKELIIKLLDFTDSYQQYLNCIIFLSKELYDEHQIIDSFSSNHFANKENIGTEMSYLYPILQGEIQEKVLNFSLEKINNLYDYIYFINKNNIKTYSVGKFRELLELMKFSAITYSTYYILAELRKKDIFQELHQYIDESTLLDKECIRFFLAPFEYDNEKNVEVPWILSFDEDNRQMLFKKEVYKNKLKQYICDPLVQEGEKLQLLKYL